MELIKEYSKTMQLRIARHRINEDIKSNNGFTVEADSIDGYHFGFDPSRINEGTLVGGVVTSGRIVDNGITGHRLNFERTMTAVDEEYIRREIEAMSMIGGIVTHDPFYERPVGRQLGNLRGITALNDSGQIPPFDPMTLPLRVMGPDGDPVENPPAVSGTLVFTGVTAPQGPPAVSFHDDWFDIRLGDGTVIRARDFNVVLSENQEDTEAGDWR